MFLYQLKPSLMSNTEKEYFDAIKKQLPAGYLIQPQVNLASIIERLDHARYQNELFRNIDFCVTDKDYKPICLIEINDETHNQPDRRKRDAKVKQICAEAGIEIVTFWTRFGIKPSYIKMRVDQAIKNHATIKPQEHVEVPEDAPPTAPPRTDPRVQAFEASNAAYAYPPQPAEKKGCYIATAVYGSYDCPEVWVLRRYRDFSLDTTWYGHLFIKMYYKISPWLVHHFRHTVLFQKLGRKLLDRKVRRLQNQGYAATPYKDRRF